MVTDRLKCPTYPLNTYQVRSAETTDSSSIEALYSEWGYKGEFTQADQMFLAETDGQIVGVVRLSFESGVYILRGMFIKTKLQGNGIGSILLKAVHEWLGNNLAYCVPFTHLAKFYGQIGFYEINDSDAPPFLGERKKSYLAKGHNVLLMKRSLPDV